MAIRILFKLLKTSVVAFLCALLSLSVCFALLQTKWAKKKTGDWFVEKARENGIALSLGKLEGKPPFNWTLRDIHVQINPTDSFSIKTLTVRFSLLPLLRKQIGISYLNAQHVSYLYAETSGSLPELKTLSLLSLPFSISLQSAKLSPLYIENLTKKESTSLTLQIKAKLAKEAKEFIATLKSSLLTHPNSHVELFLSGSASKDQFKAGIRANLLSTRKFLPFIPWEADLSLQGFTEGSLSTCKALLLLAPPVDGTPPLETTLKGHINALSIPAKPWLNRKWELKSKFSLFADHSLRASSLLLQSDLFRFLGQADFDRTLTPKRLLATLAFEDLSLLHLPLSLKGALKAQLSYEQEEGFLEFATKDLFLDSLPFESAQGSAKAKKEKDGWKGDVHLLACHRALSLEGKAQFEFAVPDKLWLKDLCLTAPDATLSGSLFLDFSPFFLEGDIFAHANHLDQFRPLFQGVDLEGKLGAEIHFSRENKEDLSLSSQSVQLHATLKNLHYEHLLADQMTLSAHLINPLGGIKGSLSLEGEKLSYSPLFFSKVDFDMHWEEGKWPFYCYAKGRWKEDLEIKSAGFFETAPEKKSLLFEEFSGFALKKPFFLERAFAIHWNPLNFQVDQCALRLGEGRFFTSINARPNASKFRILAEHFPIDFLALPLPYFSLNGISSLDAYLEASENSLRGRINLLLEHADLIQVGKTDPLRAKGSLQANFHQNTVQIHAHIKASGDQFLDWSATLPIAYTTFPLHMHIERRRPLSSELTMEGKLEELFDFVNIGSHRATGMLFCHLFLSNQLISPSLQGTLELRSGTYENYYTGTFLKEIEASLKAEKGALTLKELLAKDEKEGKLKAAGQLLLQPDLKFPYEIHAALDNLNCIRFDSVDANLTGPLTVSGDASAALAKGSLAVSHADLKIPEELPIEIPTLPVTYIHSPLPLSSQILSPLPIFPLKLDLDLKSDGHVFLRGNGLNSEWKGDVHLTGTNTTFFANGLLSLLKGEFIFSGKVFSLTQGEITFSDKPTQSAYLNLSGTLNLSDITVNALLRGPLSAPQLTFQSIPHIPTSSILARILFNKDISEISPIQAIQLAQMVVTLSGGGGPDILEAIRKTLGVDRLNIVSSSSGSDEISVQIGKYLTRGVMLTLSQSASSSNIIVEVELKKGFILQAETQEDEEGKFSFKWNHNY